MASGLQGKCLYLPDTCQAHAHHRAKLQVRSLRHHTTRHFSVANLMRLSSVQQRAVSTLEAAIDKTLVRKLQPAPGASRKLQVFFEVLYELDAPRHDRKAGKSTAHCDIEAFLQAFNGDPVSETLEHFCLLAPGRTCCGSLEECKEKCTIAAINLLVGGDRIPCESRRTHLLPAMQRTLTRVVIKGLGLQHLFNDISIPAPTTEALEGDDAAKAEFFKELTGVRASRAAEYFANPTNKFELGVLVVVVGVADRLLYALLGGVSRDAPPCKVSTLLHRQGGLLAEVLADLLTLLDRWLVGGALRKPWCVLDILGAPVDDLDFALFARSQILRTAAAIHRRYEAKFADWPYKLFKLCSSEWTPEEKQAVALSAISSPRCCLDSFTAGFRIAFPTAEDMLTAKASELLSLTFDTIRVTTDFCERQHAEVQAGRPTRSGAREFTHASRESLLNQLRVVHLNSNGEDPLTPAHVAASAEHHKAIAMPLLVPSMSLITSPSQAALGGAPASDLGGGGRPLQLVPVEAKCSHASSHASHHGPALGGATSSVPPLPSVYEATLVVLDGGRRAEPDEAGEAAVEPERKRAGLNPYFTFKNMYLKAAKEAAGGRKLTNDEVARLQGQAKERWAALGNKGVYEELYQSWREAPRQRPEGDCDTLYKPQWGGGNRASPISARELWELHNTTGWPKDEEVFDQGAFRSGACAEEVFEDSVAYRLWGCARSGLATCKASLEHPAAFFKVHTGLCNFIEHIGKETADRGDVMLMVEGDLRGDPGNCSRDLAIIAGVAYSPKCFDAVLCHFDIAEHSTTMSLPLPFDCSISRRVRIVLVLGGGGGRTTHLR